MSEKDCAPRASDAGLVVGLAFLWLCLKSVPLELSREVRHGVLETAAPAAFLLYGLYVLAIVAAMVALRKRPCALRPALAVGALAGMGAFALEGAAAGGVGLLALFVVLLAVFVAVYLMAGAGALTQCDPRRAAFLAALSYAVAEGLRFAASLTDVWWLKILYPAAAFAALWACRPAPRAAGVGERASLQLLPWGILGACIVLMALWSVMLGVLPAGALSDLGAEDRTWSYGLSFVLIAFMALYFWWCVGAIWPERLLMLVPFAAIVVLYLFGLTAMQAFPGHEFVSFKRVFIAVAQCLEVLGFIVIVFGVAEKHLSVAAPMVLYATLLNAGLWMVVADVLRHEGLPQSTAIGEASVFFLSFVTAVICIGMLLAWNVRQGKRSVRSQAAPEASLCGEAAHKAGLSGREEEVLVLLYRGLSAKRIAEKLYVSENTVRSHTNSIYKKLGVHSKQELMELVDTYGE